MDKQRGPILNSPAQPTTRQSFTIESDHAEQRIDNFLFTKLKKVPKSLIYRLVRKGAIRVNKKRVKPEYKLQAQDIIELPNITQEVPADPGMPSNKSTRLLENNILYEDKNLIIVNKPAGIASHGGSGINFGVIEIMRAARPKLKSLELVHRLDRDTSGCLILAKKRSTLKELHELLQAGKVTKKYLLLVYGKWSGGTRKVTARLQKNSLKSGERIVTVNEDGKKALTIFHPKKIFTDTTLLEAELGTGRTHQLRVHAAHLGHPIAGDEKYGDKDFNGKMYRLGLKRLFLHAYSLSFCLPTGRQKIQITAPIPKELQKIIED